MNRKLDSNAQKHQLTKQFHLCTNDPDEIMNGTKPASLDFQSNEIPYFSLSLFHSITSSETIFHVRPNFLSRSRKFHGTLSLSEANNPVRSTRIKLESDRPAKMALVVEDRCTIRSNFRGSLS